MRVLILNPPVPRGSLTNRDLMGGMGINDDFGTSVSSRFVAFLKNQGTRMPVMTLGYAAALLAPHVDVEVLDLGHEASGPETLARAAAVKPEWIVAATSFAYLGTELKFLSELHARTGAKRLLVGQTATHYAKEILERGLAEFIASGDPEVAVSELAKGAKELGERVRERFLNVDALPFPDWSKFPRDDYAYFPLLKKKPFLPVLSSRGCPYGCSFCPYPVAQGAPFRGRSAKNVVDELQHLIERYGVQSVLFRDPTFTLDLDRAADICRLILERGLKLEFGIETRLDRMESGLIELLGRAGCTSVEFGVDPLEQETLLANHRRPLAPKKVHDVVKALEANGMRTAGLAVLGLPEQSLDEMKRTIEWVDELGLSYINYELATPFPGTALYEEAVNKGWARPIQFDELLEGDPKLTFNGKVDVAATRALQDEALRRFYVRPSRVAKEVLSGSMLDSARFFAQSGLRFLGRARSRQ
ncbi:MAG: radical SAM protein [Archangium sp.]|nr:radical SAM protein [Archangium sp.]